MLWLFLISFLYFSFLFFFSPALPYLLPHCSLFCSALSFALLLLILLCPIVCPAFSFFLLIFYSISFL